MALAYAGLIADTEETRVDGRGRPPIHSDDEILEVALRTFAASGYDGVSVRSIGQELGLSHGAINQRFGSKDALFRAAVDHGFGGVFAEVGEQLRRLPTPVDDLEALRNMVRVFLDTVRARPELAQILTHEGAAPSRRLDHLAGSHLIPNVGPAAGALDRLGGSGVIRPITVRGLFFLVALGAAAPFTLTALSEHFDEVAGTLDPDGYSVMITDVVIAGLRLPSRGMGEGR